MAPEEAQREFDRLRDLYIRELESTGGAKSMKTILMSIRARHIRNMRKGRKGWEIRKTCPKIAPPFRVQLCESGSGGKVTAMFTCTECLDVTDYPAERIAKMASITREEAEGYKAKGRGRLYAWKVDRFYDKRPGCWVNHVTDYGVNRPPQSWCYVKEAVENA